MTRIFVVLQRCAYHLWVRVLIICVCVCVCVCVRACARVFGQTLCGKTPVWVRAHNMFVCVYMANDFMPVFEQGNLFVQLLFLMVVLRFRGEP